MAPVLKKNKILVSSGLYVLLIQSLPCVVRNFNNLIKLFSRKIIVEEVNRIYFLAILLYFIVKVRSGRISRGARKTNQFTLARFKNRHWTSYTTSGSGLPSNHIRKFRLDPEGATPRMAKGHVVLLKS